MTGNLLPHISKETFLNISHTPITTFSLRRCKVSSIARDTFGALPYLESLDLSENNVSTQILQEAFAGLRNSQIRYLTLSSEDAKVYHLPLTFLRWLQNTSLEYFELSGYLTKLNGVMFENMSKLTSINMADNDIYNINNIKVLHRVQTLNLSMNKITSRYMYCPNIMHNPSNITVLDISRNRIANLKFLGPHGTCFPRIRILHISYNPISILQNDTFFNLKSLEELDASYLLAYTIEIQPRAFHSNTLRKLYFASFQELEPLQKSCKNFPFLRYCDTLTHLDMTNAKICPYILKLLISPLKKLQSLVLKGCRLITIPDVIGTFHNLKHLDMEDNKISFLNVSIFRPLTKLQSLIMSDNRISSIQNDDFPQKLLNTIKSMDFSYNPFSCSCILYWFRFWAENNKDKLSGYPALYQCYSPLELSGRSISNYNPSYFTCHKLEAYQIILISSGSVLFVAIFAVCIVSKYKWHMRYYIYLLRSRRRENTSHVTNDYLYDAFVAYSAEDRSWVISNLMAKLEGEENFRLCLHERDFLPGRTIYRPDFWNNQTQPESCTCSFK